MSYLCDNRLELLKSGVYTPVSYLAEEQRLLGQLDELKEKAVVSGVEIEETISDATRLSELINRLAVYYEEAISVEKEQITRTLFSELTMDEKSFAYSLKSEFNALKQMSVGFCAPDVWLSELVRDRAQIKQAISTLTRLGL